MSICITLNLTLCLFSVIFQMMKDMGGLGGAGGAKPGFDDMNDETDSDDDEALPELE
jgi:hypothetical protein